MPIHPSNRLRYPDDWEEVARWVKDQAGWRCECAGECGRPAAHLDDGGRCPERHGQLALNGRRDHVIILTVAHLDHQPENCERGNLRAFCPGCHLHYDREHHRQSGMLRAREALEAAGQLVLGAA